MCVCVSSKTACMSPWSRAIYMGGGLFRGHRHGASDWVVEGVTKAMKACDWDGGLPALLGTDAEHRPCRQYGAKQKEALRWATEQPFHSREGKSNERLGVGSAGQRAGGRERERGKNGRRSGPSHLGRIRKVKQPRLKAEEGEACVRMWKTDLLSKVRPG